MNDDIYLENYDEGFRSGQFDRVYREEISIISSTWPDYSLPGYSKGYKDGYYNALKLKGVRL
jgi:hypothetical protein